MLIGDIGLSREVADHIMLHSMDSPNSIPVNT